MDEMIGGDPGASPLSGGGGAILERADMFIDKVGAKIPPIGKILSRTELSSRSLLLMVLALLLLLILPPLIRHLMIRLKWTRSNFRDEVIPQSFGVVIVLFTGMMLAATAWLYPLYRPQAKLWLVAVLGFGVLGLLDDLKGDKQIKGLRGHFSAAAKGKFTTGFLKAVGGILLSLFLSWNLHNNDIARLLLDAALIALCANFINLLDLRPGRAGAVFLVLGGAVLLFGIRTQGAFAGVSPLLFVVLAALVVYERDARATVMLGDVGSNTLGACLGLALAQSACPTVLRGIFVLLLLGIHIVAERISLTKLISDTPLLRTLDALTGVRVQSSASKS